MYGTVSRCTTAPSATTVMCRVGSSLCCSDFPAKREIFGLCTVQSGSGIAFILSCFLSCTPLLAVDGTFFSVVRCIGRNATCGRFGSREPGCPLPSIVLCENQLANPTIDHGIHDDIAASGFSARSQTRRRRDYESYDITSSASAAALSAA